MENISKIIDSLSSSEQNVMYNALQKRLDRSPEYTIDYDEEGCVYDGKFECIQHACCADENHPVKYVEVEE